MAHTNTRGTFLIRESEQNPGGFALSIKDWDQERNFHVKHYKIKPLDNNRGYYITTRQTFATLQDLVVGYQVLYRTIPTYHASPKMILNINKVLFDPFVFAVATMMGTNQWISICCCCCCNCTRNHYRHL